MELVIIIGLFSFVVWLVPTLHNIRRRDQEQMDKKIAFAKWANEQQDPHIVSMVQNLLREKRFKTWEEAAKYAEQTLNAPLPESRSNVHANDKEGTPT
jgi:phage gp46-like protein